MLANKDEIGMLKLMSHYKDCPVNPPACGDTIAELKSRGYIRCNRSKTSLRLSSQGYDLLSLAEIEFKRDSHPVSDGRILSRRLWSAEMALLFHAMQIDVCLDTQPDTIKEPAFISSQAIRRQFYANVLGMAKFGGILYTPDIAYIVYNLDASANGFYPATDENIFRREMIRIVKNVRILFMGKAEAASKGSPEDLVNSIMVEPIKKRGVGSNYSSALHEFSFPVYLVPLSLFGVKQMRVILSENYKEKLAKHLLGRNFLPVMTEWVDALIARSKECMIVMFDMDLKRLDRALNFTKPLHILVLEEQYAAIIKYLDEAGATHSAEIYTIKSDEALEILDIKPLPDLKQEPYITSKGGCVNVSAT